MRNCVVIGLLGPTLDAGISAKRWDRWRPTVALCQHEDFLINRFELLYQSKFTDLVKAVAQDIKSVSPETEISLTKITMEDPWDFEEVYGTLHDFTKKYVFKTEQEDYLIHITTGSHVSQICLFLLTESRHLPGKLIQTSPPDKWKVGDPGTYRIIDLDLSIYDRIASRFKREQKDEISFLKSGIKTKNKDFNKLIERIEQVAIASKEPILLMGPTGAGKSLLAKRIYELKKMRHQIEGGFVDVNCATLRGDVTMSALFGHVKGAFTGAVGDRQGLLRAADKGLLFLDEIGDLGMDQQTMLQ